MKNKELLQDEFEGVSDSINETLSSTDDCF